MYYMPTSMARKRKEVQVKFPKYRGRRTCKRGRRLVRPKEKKEPLEWLTSDGTLDEHLLRTYYVPS